MKDFPDVPCRVSDDKKNLVTLEEVTLQWSYGGESYEITVPEGFEFKVGIKVRFGSLGLIDLFGPSFALYNASCFHDRGYWLRENYPEEAPPRRAVDEIMRLDEGDPKFLRETAHNIVRAVGWTVW